MRKFLNVAQSVAAICLLGISADAAAQETSPSSFGPASPPYRAGPPIAIVGGQLIDATGAAPKQGFTVLIEGNTITRIAPSEQITIPPRARVIHAEGMTVMPGLINSNGHVSLNPIYPAPATDFPLAELKRRWKEQGKAAADRAYFELMQGVTTLRHTGGSYHPANVEDVKRRIDAGEIAGPRMFFSGGLLMSEPSYRDFVKENHTPAESLDYVRNDWVYRVIGSDKDLEPILSNRYPYWKIYFSSKTYDGTNDYTDAEIQRIVTIAHRHEKKVDVHANNSNAGFKRLLKFDIDSIEHPFATDFLIDETTLQGFARKGIVGISLIGQRTAASDLAKDPNRLSEIQYIMSTSPAEYQTLLTYRDKMLFNKRHPDRGGLPIYQPNESESDMFGQNGPSYRKQVLQGETVRENVRRWLKAGVKLAMGTDGTTFLNFQQNAQEATEMATLVSLGMTPMQAIISATRTGAEVLGMQDRLGTIEEGKLADIILVEGDPLKDITAMRRVVYVVKDGIRFK
jgi:imidazolonepropionase-like amidohydrolase